MAFIEIIERSLYQSDANPAVVLKLDARGIDTAIIFDLGGLLHPVERVNGRIVCVRWPIDDGPLGDVTMLHALASLGADAVGRGAAAVAMCEMGRNRSGLLAAMIVARLHGISGIDAMALVRRANPEAIANPWFAQFLRELSA